MWRKPNPVQFGCPMKVRESISPWGTNSVLCLWFSGQAHRRDGKKKFPILLVTGYIGIVVSLALRSFQFFQTLRSNALTGIGICGTRPRKDGLPPPRQDLLAFMLDCCRFRKSRYFSKLNLHEFLRREKVEEICRLRRANIPCRTIRFPRIH